MQYPVFLQIVSVYQSVWNSYLWFTHIDCYIYSYVESKNLILIVQQYEEFICFPNLIKKG